MHRLFLVFALAAACGQACAKPNDPPKPAEKSTLLQEKFDRYLALSREVQGPHGWVMEDVCDGLLFAGLTAAATGEAIDIEAARDDDLRWHRTPKRDCYPDNSKSTISRDMFLGLYWYVFAHGRKDLAKDTFQYGERNSWVMGEGPISRTALTPNMQATLGLLTGEEHIQNYLEPQFSRQTTDYAAHLDAIHLALRAVIGRVTRVNFAHAISLVEREPNNPLFHAVLGIYSGDQTKAVEMLLSERLFPNDRLPTSADHCESWVTQRAEMKEGAVNPDWLPCPEEGRTHSGGDFLFAAAIALGRFQ